MDFISKQYDLHYEKLSFQIPPDIKLGELSLPISFDLAKKLKRSPQAIAREIASQIGKIEAVSRVEAAGAGYINLYLDRAQITKQVYTSIVEGRHGLVEREREYNKIIVEHTNINPNKAAHIGHLRNATIGDAFVRVLTFLGCNVETQNYIDDTGVQLADVIVGFKYLNRMSLEQIKKIDGKFDYYCWDLYAKVSAFYETSPESLQWRTKTLKEIEERDKETGAMADHVATRIMRAHLATMQRINVHYDLLPRESDILRLRFWDRAFARLKEQGAIVYSKEGKSAGCWVMRIEKDQRPAVGPGDAGDEAQKSEEEKIIVRSDGTVTYVGKDIAYQLWKFGLLGMDFYYRPFQTYPSGRVVWVTASEKMSDVAPRGFGKADRVYNVIDSRQSYLQNVVVEGLRALGYEDQAANSIHFSYEMVALSPACCQELGIELSEEDKKRSFVEVSGRKGLGVKADDLLDKLLEKALLEVKQRHDLPEDTARQIAQQIAVSALRYFMVKFARNSLIAFDLKEALSFQGETGPYIQYSVVRANNIFRKLGELGDGSAEQIRDFVEQGNWASFLAESPDIWDLVYTSARLSEAARQVMLAMEVSHLAKYAFSLAQKFNLFYHRYQILSEVDKNRKLFLLMLADITRKQLTKALDMMGIEIPERM